MAVPLQVMVSMSGFPVHSDGQCAISLWFNNGVQEGDGPIVYILLRLSKDN